MRRKKRQTSQTHHLQIQQSKIIYNNQSQTLQKCSLCKKTGILISPCQCTYKYHDQCLLKYISRLIKKGLQSSDQIDLNTIKCRNCQNQFHVFYTHRNQYNCTVFTQRMSKNCCNRHIILITTLIVIIIITVTILVNFIPPSSSRKDSKLTYGLIALIVIEGLILLAALTHFMHSYLLLKQVILQRVLQTIELRSLGSNSSDDNKISDDCEIIIRQQNVIN